MEKQKISEEQKEKLRKMLQDQQERSRERLREWGRRAEDDDQGVLLGGVFGRVGFVIASILFGSISLLVGVQGLGQKDSLPPDMLTSLRVALTMGVILLAMGILNLIVRHFKMLLVNGLFLTIAGVFVGLSGNFFIGALQLAIGIYFLSRYSNTVKFRRHRGRAR